MFLLHGHFFKYANSKAAGYGIINHSGEFYLNYELSSNEFLWWYIWRDKNNFDNFCITQLRVDLYAHLNLYRHLYLFV